MIVSRAAFCTVHERMIMFLSNRLRVASTLILSAAAVFAAAHICTAQTTAAPQPPILSLNDTRNPIHYTPDQQRQLFKMRLDLQNEALQLKSDKTMTDAQKQTKFAANEKSDFDAFKATLSPTQNALIKQQVTKQKAVFDVRRQNAVIYQGLKDKLTASLSDTQKKEAEALKTAEQSKADTINESSATPDVKRKQLLALQSDAEAKLEAIFTPSQKSWFEQMNALNAAEPAAEAKAARGQ